MSCNTPITVVERIICARLCTERFNDTPVAVLNFSGITLSDDSLYYDSGVTASREIRWGVYVGNTLIYDFGFNGANDTITELGNGSTYGSIDMGVNNQDMIYFLDNLPNTIIPIGTTFSMYIEVRDDTGVMSQNISNVFMFTKYIELDLLTHGNTTFFWGDTITNFNN